MRTVITPVNKHRTAKQQQRHELQKTSESPEVFGSHPLNRKTGAQPTGSVKANRSPQSAIWLLAGCMMVAGCSKSDVKDSRLQAPTVAVFKAESAGSNSRTFTGIVEARVQSDLG